GVKRWEGGPQMCSSVSRRHTGAKNASPSTWSRCRCVSSTWIVAGGCPIRATPSVRSPVPASRTIRVSSPVSTSTQDVFPPYRSVSRPGVASEPRQPQTLARTLAGRLFPEEDHSPDELVRPGEHRKGGDRELVVAAVEAGDAVAVVRRPSLEEGDALRHLLEWHRPAVPVPHVEELRPLLCGHLPGFGERPAEDLLRGFVVVDELSRGVRDERRGVELGGELPREDRMQA